MAPLSLLLLLGASSALASPARIVRQETATATATGTASAAEPTATEWNAGAVVDYPIHSSCNRTERLQLERALGETIILAQHAKDHINRWGNSSEIYQKYFGNASTAEPAGWFDKVVNSDKGGLLFRCDDPDGNCKLPGYGGHWRGENATSETVICPLSFEKRRNLEGVCGFGYTVSNSPKNTYFATDLLHRLYHMPGIGEETVEHYAGKYDECLELAESNPAEAVRNSDSLQYFAIEAYAFDIALPGEGCVGVFTPTPSAGAPSQTAAPSGTKTEAPSATTEAPKECHTHSDGTEHCT